MKRLLLLLILTGWASISFTQTTPTITVQKLLDSNGNYSSNLYGKTGSILAGQKDTFKIVISEPSEEQSGFFSQTGQLKVFLPDDTGLSLDDAVLTIPPITGQSDISFDNDSLSTDKDTLYTDVKVSTTDNKDKIVIDSLIIEFPDYLADGDDFTLEAWADFMDTDDDDAADTTVLELVTFKYAKPELTLSMENGEACHGEKVECYLDITPDTLRYNLMINNTFHKKVTHGDTAHFNYNDTVTIEDPNNGHADGKSSPVTISDSFFHGISLEFSDGEPEYICEGSPVDIEFNVEGGCEPTCTLKFVNHNIDTSYVVDDDFESKTYYEFYPEMNGELIVEANYGDKTLRDTLEINQFLGRGGTYDLNIGPVARNQPELNLFDYMIPSYDYDEITTLKIDPLYNEYVDYFTTGYVNDETSYTFGRFYVNYNDSTENDSVFDPEHQGVTYGIQNPNKVTFTYGKYHPEHGGVFCYDEQETNIHVSQDKVYIKKNAFCSYDEDEYVVQISDDIDAPEVDTGYYVVANYHGYEVMVNDGSDSINTESVDSFAFVPSNLFRPDQKTKVEIKAIANVEIHAKPDSCPPNWPIDENPVIYEENQRVHYFNTEYEAKRDIYMGESPPPQNGDGWQTIKPCTWINISPRTGADRMEPKDTTEKCKKDTSQFSSKIVNPGGYWSCNYMLWTETGNPQPIYEVDDRVTFNGVIYECNSPAYHYEKPNKSAKWDSVNVCGNTMNDPPSIRYTYASNIFYIYPPATDGEFLNLDNEYCITNDSIELLSNYTIDTVENHHNSIVKYGEDWYFTPEKLIEEGVYADTTQLQLIYRDDHNCIDTVKHEVRVNEAYGYNKDFDISQLNSSYCAVDMDYNLTSALDIERMEGYGVWKEENSFIFNPDTAASNSSGYTYENDTITLEMRVRDNKQCRYDSTHTIVLHATPSIDNMDIEGLCKGDTTRFTSSILYGEDTDSIWNWQWNFGDQLSFNREGWSNYELGNTHNGNTSGTYGSPSHRYSKPGVYPVIFNVTADNGCTGTFSDTVVIGDIPDVDFTVDGFYQGNSTEFTNNTSFADFDPVTEYTWDFDNNNGLFVTNTNTDTTIMYDTARIHHVRLKATTGNGCSDSILTRVPIFPVVEVDDNNPYHQRFDQIPEGWFASHEFDKGYHSGWTHKPVEGALNISPNQSGMIWQTPNPDSTLHNENSWVESPCFDMDNLNFPLLSLDIFQAVEEGRDGAVVQYSLDDGDTWKVVGTESQGFYKGLNWYNKSSIVSNPGEQTDGVNMGWSKNTGKWETARFPIDGVKADADTTGEVPCVRFRVAYSSDAGNVEDNIHGFAFDNFLLTRRSRIVMLEQFINYPFDSIVAAREENWLTEFVEARPQEVVDMRYHNFIGLTKDSLFFINPPDISSRSVEYGANYTQLTMVDGLHRCVADNSISAKDSVEKYYNKRTLIDKRFNIEVEIENTDSTLDVTAHVTKLTDKLITGPGSQKSGIRMAIVQKEYIHGQDTAKNLMVELLPNGIGNVVDYIPDDFPVDSTFSVQDSWKPNVTTIGNEYRLVVYVQGIWGIDEIHQVWFTDLDSVPQVEVEEEDDDDDDETTTNKSINGQSINLYPNPAKNQLNVEWEQPLKNIVNWKLLAISGKIMKEGKITAGRKKEKINVRGMHEGIYVLILEDPVAKILEKRKIIILE